MKTSSTHTSDERRHRVSWLALSLFGLPFFGVGVGMNYVTWSTWLEARNARTWVTVPARIEQPNLKSGETSSVVCTYHYEYQGKVYTGTRVGLNSGSDNIGSWQERTYHRLNSSFQRNQPVDAYVNPRDPSQAVLDRALRFELLLFLMGFACVFGSVGAGFIVGSLLARPKRQNVLTNPDQPWLANSAWASGELSPEAKLSATAGVIVTLYWWVSGVPVLALLPQIWETGVPRWHSLALLHSAIGVIFVAATIKAALNQRRWGRTSLRLRTVPGFIGGKFATDLVLRGQFEGLDRVDATLQCIETRTVRTGENSRTQHNTLWENTVTCDSISTRFGEEELRLPFEFTIPYTCRPTDDPSGPGKLSWHLQVRADVPGVNLNHKFEVPIYCTAGSLPTAKGPSAPIGCHATSVAPSVPRPERISEHLNADGSVTYVISRWGDWGLFGGFASMGLIFAAVGIMIAVSSIGSGAAYVTAPFGGLLCLMGTLLLVGALSTLGENRVTLLPNGILVGRRRFGPSRPHEILPENVALLEVKQNASRGNRHWFKLSAQLHSGRKVTLAAMLDSEVAADWLRLRVARHLGLLASHSDADSPPLG